MQKKRLEKSLHIREMRRCSEVAKKFRLYTQVVIKTASVVISRCCFAEDGTVLL